MFALLKTFSWQELLHHPWRNGAAVLAVMLGVALAFSVALINASALSEFSQAVRSVNGEPDLELRAASGRMDEALYPLLATDARVAVASPVLELGTYALAGDGKRSMLRVVGVDALQLARVSPGLMPLPATGADRMALFSPETVFLNASARQALLQGQTLGQTVQLQIGLQWRAVRVAGSVSAAGPPLAVMDIGALQDLFGRGGQLTRIDLRLKPGADRDALLRELRSSPLWTSALSLAAPADAGQRISNVSRAYRVNLTVLALVALFTGAFLVFSVLALSVAKRAQQFALLGVLGLSGGERLRLVLAESLVLGSVGSVAGLALGTALAWLALRLLGGDLGGGFFPGVSPPLQWNPLSATGYGLLGVASALAGGWVPARAAQQMAPAQTLKGVGADHASRQPYWLAPLLLLGCALLTLAPPVFGIALAAYVAIGLLLVGGIAILPGAIALVLDRIAPVLSRWLLPMLALERARRVRASAAVAVSGVVAALSLAVALTVMVASFRQSVDRWLDVVLPADLYVRTATAAGAGDTAFLPATLVAQVSNVPGVSRTATLRTVTLSLDAAQANVALLSRAIGDPQRSLPLVGTALAVPAGAVGIYVSEPMVDLYGARRGEYFAPLAKAWPAIGVGDAPRYFVAGVWRDYARQFGAIAMDKSDYERLSGDVRSNDLALWLEAGADSRAVQQAIRALTDQSMAGSLLDFASAGEIRALSLRIFDRSFAVTYWLQAVAIAIGLFGVAANFSAQVLARRKEFGLLVHLGLTRRQILRLVAAEGLVWTTIGALAGLLLGLLVSLILVHIVNPQSFHWSMDLLVPWDRLILLCVATIAAGTCTAWLSARAAAGRDAVLAVKQDW
ncbi:MAG: FtsX-like permease family protein [Rhodoferax sp.]|nr:FtsX-like permease family protein [Rhodoferax sp.]